MTRNDPELNLTGVPSTDANRIVEYAKQQPSQRQQKRDIYREGQRSYDDYVAVKRALEQADNRGVDLGGAPETLAKNIADDPHGDVMDRRSRTARIADKSTTANRTTRDFETWAKQPNRRDFPGVDTLAEGFRAQRTREALDDAQEQGIIRDVKVFDELYGGEAGGEFNPENSDILLSAEPDNATRNLIHEIGHGIDLEAGNDGFASEEVFDDLQGDRRQEVEDELFELSRERRGQDFGFNPEYQRDPKELTADFAALAVEDPQRARRAAPTAQQAFAEAGVLGSFFAGASEGGPGEPREQPDNALGIPEDMTVSNNEEEIFGAVEDMGPTEEFDLF